MLGYDAAGPAISTSSGKQMKEEFGIERVGRFAGTLRLLFIDAGLHGLPANTPEEEDLHIVTRTWCAENGVKLHEREGIGHQVAAEAFA